MLYYLDQKDLILIILRAFTFVCGEFTLAFVS